MNRILIATDGSPASREAVEFGVELAEEHDASVVFVHVIPLLDRVPMSGFGMVGAVPHAAKSTTARRSRRRRPLPSSTACERPRSS
jgi:nucleotide-binding universal stress UspA family protein